MICRWFKERRRGNLSAVPFPDGWREIVDRNVAHYRRLNEQEKEHLQGLIQAF